MGAPSDQTAQHQIFGRRDGLCESSAFLGQPEQESLAITFLVWVLCCSSGRVNHGLGLRLGMRREELGGQKNTIYNQKSHGVHWAPTRCQVQAMASAILITTHFTDDKTKAQRLRSQSRAVI